MAAASHKVIGLVSGGKDSCFSLLHAVANGHEIVALATLTPEAGVDELDSHLFQSVGTSVPPLIAQAVGVPHFARVIKGKAVETGAEYGGRSDKAGVDGDETEDLMALLRDVMAAHPDATALASGAILSSYQRLRIEHVCARLGLVSLAYLWQAKQMPLVDRMIGCGMDVVIVKVAGVGLGARHVGKKLAEVRPLLGVLEARYGSHPAGEGGEYETITVDTPLFSHRIELENTEVVVSDPEPHEVAYLRIGGARLVEKPGWQRPSQAELRSVLGLPADAADGYATLDEDEVKIVDDLLRRRGSAVAPMATPVVSVNARPSASMPIRFAQHGAWFAASVDGLSKGDGSVEDELSQCFDGIAAELTRHACKLTHIAHINLLLSSMVLFPAANAAYTQRFGTSPPSRATVAVLLPPGQRVRLEVTGFDDSGSSTKRSALHVQGLSYWAPANIGPYSQAVTAGGRVHMAGQIPLVPATLALPPTVPNQSPYPLQAALAVQHTRRVIEALRSPVATGGGWAGAADLAVVWWVCQGAERASAHADVVDAYQSWTSSSIGLGADWQSGFDNAPTVFVQTKELPRGALVEVQVCMDTLRRIDTEQGMCNLDLDGDVEYGKTDFLVAELDGEDGIQVRCDHCKIGGSMSRAIHWLSDAALQPPLGRIINDMSAAVAIRAYHVTSASEKVMQWAQTSEACWTSIPVLSVSDKTRKEWPVALEVFYGPEHVLPH